MPLNQAEAFMDGSIPMPLDTQIGREISYFRQFYRDLVPAVHLSYHRNAYYSLEDPELRITLDRDILWQEKDCSLSALPFGHSLLGAGQSLLEIKTASSVPLWLVTALSRAGIQQTSFSKYGMAYLSILQNNYRTGGVFCA